MKPTLLFIAALVLLAGPLGAQSDEDVFAEGAFDAAVAQGQAADEANRLVWLAGINLVSNSTLTLPADRGAWASQSLFTGKGFLKAASPNRGSLFVAYTFNHTLWASTDDPALSAAYAAAGPNPAVPVYRLSEAHLSFDAGKLVFFRLGNQLLDWGAAAVWSPADFINRRSADPSSPIDVRAGKPGLRVHVPFNGGNLFAFADASRSLTDTGVPRNLLETGSLGVRVDTVVAGWNLGWVGNAAPDQAPRSGLTAVGALAGVDLWLEAAATLPGEGREASWSAALGGERTWGTDSDWTLRGEAYWNPSGHPDTALVGPELSQFVPYYWGQLYGYAELLKKKLLGPDVTGSLSATGNFSDASWTGTASLRTAFPGSLPFSLYVQANGGPSDREFTLATRGPAVTLGLRSVLEF